MNTNFDENFYKKILPNLVKFEIKPDTESDTYNCISHTIGLKDRWSWPSSSWIDNNSDISKDSFISFYKYHGFEVCKNLDISYDEKYIKVALYINNSKPKHASIQIDFDWWESKVGQLGIIKHDLFELEDDTYGNVEIIFRKLKITNEILKFYP